MRVTDEQARGFLALMKGHEGVLPDMAADLLDSRAEVERLRAANARLSEALRTFADYCVGLHHPQWEGVIEDSDRGFVVRTADLWEAKRALDGK